MNSSTNQRESICSRCGTPLTGDELKGGCPKCFSTIFLSPEASVLPVVPRILRRIGDYELLEEIARGGMGIVFRARQISLNREVAVKLMRDSALAGPEEIRRFRVEATAAAKLKHPNIVSIYEVGEQGGEHYFAMDLIEGANLAERTREGPLSAKNAAELVATIADAVQHAHEQGVLHRDIKPSNVLIDSLGKPFVTDFGLARALDADSSLTMTGQVLGTPGYMPPEQATGTGTVGPTADIYSLGALLYHLVTGRAPFVGGSMGETLRHVVEQEPVSPQLLNPEVPRDLASVCLKCLAKGPTDRYVSAAALADDLRLFCRSEPTLARPAGSTERLLRWCQRKPALAAAIGLAVLVALVGLGGILWQWQHARVETERARFNAYAADMNLAGQALAENDVGRAVELLNRHRPSSGWRDLRAWEWRHLWQRSHSDERLSIGRHNDVVSAIAFTPDGTCMASASHDASVGLWDTSTWTEIRRLKLSSRINALAFSRDGNSLGVGTLDWRVRVFDWKSGDQQAVLKLSVGNSALAFTHDGNALIVGTADGILQVRGLGGDETRRRMKAQTGWVNPIALSPDGKILASTGENDNVVNLWDTTSWRPIATLDAPELKDRVTSIAFSRDSQSLLTAGSQPTFKLWNLANPGQTIAFTGHSQNVAVAILSPDEKLVASAGGDQTIHLWNPLTGRETARLQGHEDEVVSLAFSPKGQALVSGGKDGWIKLWDVPPPPTKPSFFPLVKGNSKRGISADGQIAFAKQPEGIELWDLMRRKKLDLVLTNAPFLNRIRSIVSDGRILVIALEDPEIQIFHLNPFREAATLIGRRAEGSPAISPDGRLLATVDFGGQVQVSDWRTQEEVVNWKVPSGFCSVRFAPDGRTIAIAGGEGTVEIGQISDGRNVATLNRFTDLVTGVDFSHSIWCMNFSLDGRILAVGSGDATTTLWDVVSAKRLGTLRGHRFGVSGALFSSAGTRLYTCGGDGVIKVWDWKTQQEILSLKGHSRGARLASLEEEKTIVSIGDDGIRYWEAPTFTEIEATEKAMRR